MDITENKKTKYLALDIGTKRIGIAVTDSSKKIAFPYKVIDFKNNETLLETIKDIIRQENIERVIIGDPVNIQGIRSSLTSGLYKTIDFLKMNMDIDVRLYDERYSTKTAHEDLLSMEIKNKKRKKIIDKVAAAIILQNYIEKNNQ